jgi:hypothetical protein
LYCIRVSGVYPRRQVWHRAGRKPPWYSSTRLPVWQFMFVYRMYVRTYIRMCLMMMPFNCSYRNKNEPSAIYPSFGYSPKICAVFINSPAKARGKRGREGGEANEGVRGWDRGLVRGKENEKGQRGRGRGGGRTIPWTAPRPKSSTQLLMALFMCAEVFISGTLYSWCA